MGGAVNGHRFGDEASCPFDASGLSRSARRNRDLLAEVMVGAGFVNYPTEWWHWSFGDRCWALYDLHGERHLRSALICRDVTVDYQFSQGRHCADAENPVRIDVDAAA
jgi:hypothetical protein